MSGTAPYMGPFMNECHGSSPEGIGGDLLVPGGFPANNRAILDPCVLCMASGKVPLMMRLEIRKNCTGILAIGFWINCQSMYHLSGSGMSNRKHGADRSRVRAYLPKLIMLYVCHVVVDSQPANPSFRVLIATQVSVVTVGPRPEPCELQLSEWLLKLARSCVSSSGLLLNNPCIPTTIEG